MTVQPLDTAARPPLGEADTALPGIASVPDASPFADALGRAFGAADSALGRAEGAERAFIAGRGGLQEAMLERAQADVALSITTTAASRTAQALSTILGMQV